MPIPATCTVPAGEYDSCVPFEERLLSKAYFCLYETTDTSIVSYKTGGIDLIRSAGVPNRRSDRLGFSNGDTDVEYLKVWEIPEWSMKGREVASVMRLNPASVRDDPTTWTPKHTSEIYTDSAMVNTVRAIENNLIPKSADIVYARVITSNPWTEDWGEFTIYLSHITNLNVLGNIYPSVAANFFSNLNSDEDVNFIEVYVAPDCKLDFSHCTDFSSMFWRSANWKFPQNNMSLFIDPADLVNAVSIASLFQGVHYSVQTTNRPQLVANVNAICDWIKALRLPKLSSAEALLHMFDVPTLSSGDRPTVDISKWGCENHLIADLMFSDFNCDAVIASNSKYVPYSMFSQCRAKSIDVSGSDFDTNASCVGMFTNCDKLESVDFTGTTTKEGDDTAACSSMFSNCQALESVDISWLPETMITSANMFYNCRHLTTIYSHNFTIDNKSSSMFQNCNALVGGAGTTPTSQGVVESRKYSSDYARIDNPLSEPGYFTAPA